MKVALVYDRVNKWGGAERVLLVLHEMFPEAPLYTSVYNPETAPWAGVFAQVYTSFLQKVPFVKNWHEGFGWLTPLVFEAFDFSNYDLVISVTSEAAKGIITKPSTKHVCYCLTPTRYLWSGYDLYFRNPSLRFISKPAVSYLKNWDKIAAQRPDKMVAVSTEVQKRIERYYNRDSKIIYPPVDIEKFKRNKNTTSLRSDVVMEGDYYILVSRLVAYKKVDLAIEAFNELGLPLIVVGTGSEENRLRKMAKPNVKFVKNLTDKDLANYYQNARSFLMPQEEDFGIAAVEAQATGCPVIAYKAGGALDTVVSPSASSGRFATGVLFEEQTVDSLFDAVKRFDKMEFNPKNLRENARKFSREKFEKDFLQIISGLK